MTEAQTQIVSTGRGAGFDAERVRADFPIFERKIRGKRLVFLDSAASAQRPRSVIDAVSEHYSLHHANVHRGVYLLSEESTLAFEGAREKSRRFINAGSKKEIVFVRGTTEAINLVASTFGRANVKAGDEILITTMEHHSNIVPWQAVCEAAGATLRVAPINDAGELELDEFEKLLGPKTRLVAIAHISNAIGTVNPVKRIVEMAHTRGIPVLVDGAQAAPHMKIDVQDLDCDFYAFSSHKAFGPTGMGVLYGKAERLEAMPPYQYGGDMIRSVTFEKTTYSDIPHKFEAGTPNIAGAIGMGAAFDYIEAVGHENIEAHERELLAYGTERLAEVDGLRLIGTAREKAGVISFVLEDVHPHDIGTMLDAEGIAVRTGHHCAQPLMDRYGVPATARASIAMYNTREDFDTLADALRAVRKVFAR